ncbi:RhuM family protein [Candidatus Stoquefichus massiliensis]|uniref:RhuM family protein n=1 Tax=Candidatus Stoquefichus massiliensis TaxID=1470350 RepID=UPI0018CADF77
MISVGYRVKSKRGILFRKWANKILKDYLLKGYVINNRHFQDIDYVTKILDDDHHTLTFPKGERDVYVIDYEECIELIRKTMFVDKEDQFVIEKDQSFHSSIATIYQSFGNQDLYPIIEDKASALLYFIVKNHSFIDDNKRIGATIFLYFLSKNKALYKGKKERISNDAFATLTILVASSRPEDKDIVIDLVKTLLN